VNATAQQRAELDAGPARPGIDWPAILERAGRPFAEIEIRTGDVSHDDDHASASHGVYFCEVAIDPLQPRVEVRRLVSVWDIGRVLNPKTALSQVAGCIVMGLGMTLMEETRRDPRTGRPVNDNFAEYLMPVHADMRDFDISFIDVPDPRFGSLGVRGVGELGMAGIAPAIGNAVFHATGRRIRNLPLTPPRLLAAMEGQPDPGGPPPHGR
jgi:xanthine dehydrogenase YagR molybdenum-binding subunit